MPPLLLLPFGIALAIAASLPVDRLFYRPLRKLPTIYTVISSFGVALIFRSLAQLIWGAQNEVYIRGVQRPLVLFDTIRVSALHVEAILIIIVDCGCAAPLPHALAARPLDARRLR